MVLNSLSFCLSVKLLMSPSNESLARWRILGCRFFPFITLNILCHSFLACRVSAEKSADILMGVPLYVTHCFSLAAFIFFNLFILLFYLFIYFWLPWVFVAAHRLFSCCSEWGLLFVAVCGLLIVVASLVAEHKL